MENKTVIDLKHLRDIEQNILSAMVHDKDEFLKLEKKYSSDDFTFRLHKQIFEEILLFKDKILDSKKHTNLYIDMGLSLLSKHNIGIFTSYAIITAEQEDSLEIDIVELDHYLNIKNIALENHTDESVTMEIEIEDKYGTTKAIFKQDRLIEVLTTNIFYLPSEICDTDTITFEKLNEIGYTGDNEAIMDEEELLYGKTKTIYFKKGLQDLKDLEVLYRWADKYNLEIKLFPRNKQMLFVQDTLAISDQNIKELPKELRILDNIDAIDATNNQIKFIPDEIYTLPLIGLLLVNNNIEFISSKIEDLKDIKMLSLCQNKIKSLPDSLYTLEPLQLLCLHGNKLEEISHRVGDLKNLTTLSISNNPIKYLPETIKELNNLESLDIENTLIEDISLDILSLPNLKSISIDDKHLPFIMKNFHLLKNIDTINLVHSEYIIEDKIFKDQDFIVLDEEWMDDKDYQGHGCIVLKNNKIK